jgi:FKBP-type peptidyl-prolyl cis-trans isomerase
MIRSLRNMLLTTATLAALGAGSAYAQQPAATPADAAKAAPVKLDKNKVSTMVGMDIGHGLTQVKDDIDLNVVFEAVRATIAGKKAALTEEEAAEVRQAFMQQLQEKRLAEQKAAGDKNKAESEKFLAANKAKSGVKTTASGLQYEVITEGTGAKPTANDTVKVNYVGTKVDGTKFDASADHGGSATFPLNGVIKGWSEGLQLMPVGSKYKFYIPAELAYGENGPPQIGPNAALVFEVELLGIETAAAPKADDK